MSEKKQLNEEELDKVNGGDNLDYYLPKNHGRQLSKSELNQYLNQDVYAVNKAEKRDYLGGTIIEIHESLELTINVIKIAVDCCGGHFLLGNVVGQNLEIYVDNYAIFLKN